MTTRLIKCGLDWHNDWVPIKQANERKSAIRAVHLCRPSFELCESGVQQFWDVPDNLRVLWVELSTRKMANSYRIQVTAMCPCTVEVTLSSGQVYVVSAYPSFARTVMTMRARYIRVHYEVTQ